MEERMDTTESTPRAGVTRLTFLRRAGVAAAAAGLAGCGVTQDRGALPSDVDASQFPPLPPSQPPLNCNILTFFSPDEARTVDAITARLIPGDAQDPGAREACVVSYLDQKLARFQAFAAPTYFKEPFAKPVDRAPAGEQAGAKKEILVAKKDLPRYGFQSSLTPQETYRMGLKQLDRYVRARFGRPFVELGPAEQDTVLETLQKANPSPPGVVRKQKDMRNPRAALKKAAAKHAAELASPEQKQLAKFFVKPSAYGFFSTLQDDATEGFLADPIYGGNRDFAGWKLVGYPGAQRAYTPRELTHGPHKRTVQGLAQMPAMNPGVPQDHAILPMAGERSVSP
jgi:gluconate 2-dehydrogenase gamma chain